MISRRALFLVTVIVSYFWFASGLDINTKNVELKDLLQIGGKVVIKPNSDTKNSPRSLSGDLESDLEQFFKSNEVAIEVPLIGSTVTFNGRSLDNGEFNFKLKSNSEGEQEDVESEERKIKIKKIKKHKIKKILTPILVLLVLKAITLIPLALGILGIKTWNALQLSFVSFVVSIVLAVWKFCTKVADFHPTPPTVIHEAVHDVHPTVHEVIHPHILHDHHDHHFPHHHYHDDHHYDHHHHDDHHYDLHDHHLHWRSDDAQNVAYSRSDATAQGLAYNSYAPENTYKNSGVVGEVVPVYKSDMYKTTQDM